MYLSNTRLPHLLPPSAYFCPQNYEREVQGVLKPAWHFVATTRQLKRDGDFVTLDLLGVPLQLRVFSGTIRALSNVCAHRRCLISSRSHGNSPTMKCQYHGWEYGEDGLTRKIPDPQNFAPFPEQRECVDTYRVETCGQLVFVCLDAKAPSLAEYLGKYFELIGERFGQQTAQYLRMDVDYAANWKVPIENSLESYHVPCVHESTFREDPGSSRSHHELGRRSTSFTTSLPFSPHSGIDQIVQRFESGIMRLLGVKTTGEYSQHQLFPNLLLSFTDAIALVHVVIPTGPRTAQAIIFQFGNLGKARWGPGRWLAAAWGRFKAWVTKRIVQEDLELIPEIQLGLEKSSQPGVLGKCEERIHRFQQFLAEQDRSSSPADAEVATKSSVSGSVEHHESNHQPMSIATDETR